MDGLHLTCFQKRINLASGGHGLTLYLIEAPLNAFANRADPDQAALVRAA